MRRRAEGRLGLAAVFALCVASCLGTATAAEGPTVYLWGAQRGADRMPEVTQAIEDGLKRRGDAVERVKVPSAGCEGPACLAALRGQPGLVLGVQLRELDGRYQGRVWLAEAGRAAERRGAGRGGAPDPALGLPVLGSLDFVAPRERLGEVARDRALALLDQPERSPGLPSQPRYCVDEPGGRSAGVAAPAGRQRLVLVVHGGGPAWQSVRGELARVGAQTLRQLPGVGAVEVKNLGELAAEPEVALRRLSKQAVVAVALGEVPDSGAMPGAQLDFLGAAAPGQPTALERLAVLPPGTKDGPELALRLSGVLSAKLPGRLGVQPGGAQPGAAVRLAPGGAPCDPLALALRGEATAVVPESAPVPGAGAGTEVVPGPTLVPDARRPPVVVAPETRRWPAVVGAVLGVAGLATAGVGIWGLAVDGKLADGPLMPKMTCGDVKVPCGWQTRDMGIGLTVSGGVVAVTGLVIYLAFRPRDKGSENAKR